MRFDLHCHTTASDGVLSPADLVRRAAEKQVEVLAVTDHDTLDGLDEVRRTIEAEQLPLRLVSGVEISTGAQREHRVEVLEEQARAKGMDPAELSFYLDFFRYGVPPHGGFGMGLNRVLMLMLHQPSIRETTYLFRGPNRLLP